MSKNMRAFLALLAIIAAWMIFGGQIGGNGSAGTTSDCKLEGTWEAEAQGGLVKFVRVFGCIDASKEGEFRSEAYLQGQRQDALSFHGHYRFQQNPLLPTEDRDKIQYKSVESHDWSDVIVALTPSTLTLRSYYSKNILVFHRR
jgi:hypothetical protein